MSNKKREHLIEKYWNAKTSLQEEIEIREDLKNTPAESSVEAALFAYFNDQRSQAFSKTVTIPRHRNILSLRNILGIAASVAILTIAFFSFSSSPVAKGNNHLVVDNPEEALEITLNALSMVNGSMQKSEAKILEGMHHLDKTFIFKS